MKSVLISIKPKWCWLIARGEKTIEIRKSSPRIEPPFKCYIYCTKDIDFTFYTENGEECTHIGNGKVIGEFVCDRIFPIHVFENAAIQYWNYERMYDSCLSYHEISAYIGRGKRGCGWYISDLVIYDKPKKLSEFVGLRKTKFGYEPVEVRAPQSWCYVEEMED